VNITSQQDGHMKKFDSRRPRHYAGRNPYEGRLFTHSSCVIKYPFKGVADRIRMAICNVGGSRTRGEPSRAFGSNGKTDPEHIEGAPEDPFVAPSR